MYNLTGAHSSNHNLPVFLSGLGLLATLVGTGGRAVGDLFITCMGLVSIRNLLNLLIIPGAALVAFSIFLIRWNYDILAV